MIGSRCSGSLGKRTAKGDVDPKWSIEPPGITVCRHVARLGLNPGGGASRCGSLGLPNAVVAAPRRRSQIEMRTMTAMTAMRRTSLDSLGLLPYGSRRRAVACRSLHSRPDGSNEDRKPPRHGRKKVCWRAARQPLPGKGETGVSSHSQGITIWSAAQPGAPASLLASSGFSTVHFDSNPHPPSTSRTTSTRARKPPRSCNCSTVGCSLF
jgi:hypothetical protein